MAKLIKTVDELDALMTQDDENWVPPVLQVRNVHGTVVCVLSGVRKDGRFDVTLPDEDEERVFFLSDCVVHDIS